MISSSILLFARQMQEMHGMIWHCFHFTDKKTDYKKGLK